MIRILLGMILFFWSISSAALDVNGQGDRSGVIALYDFNETTGNQVVDQITTGGQLNLVIPNTNFVSRDGASLEIIAPTGLRTSGPATKIINACRASNEVTIELWLESYTQNDLSLAAYGPARVVSLSEGVTRNGGFYLGQGYDAGHFYTLGLNARQNLNNNALVTTGAVLSTNASNTNIVRHTGNRLQHIIFTKNSQGLTRLYVGDENNTPILREQATLNASFAGTNWSNNFVLTVGNDARFDLPASGTNPLLTIPSWWTHHRNEGLAR